jgi:hypothetical protein
MMPRIATVVSVGEALQLREHAAHGSGLMRVDLIAKKGVERIDHDQAHVADLGDLLAKLLKIALQAEDAPVSLPVVIAPHHACDGEDAT